MTLNKKIAPQDVKVFILLDENPAASSSAVSGLQKSIFESFSKFNYNASWITSDEALQVTFRDPANYYVLSRFEGLPFEHLKSLKCRIYSTFFIHRCLQEQRIIRKWSYPLFSSSLESIVVSFSGIEPMIKKQKSQLVNYMMGMVLGSIVDGVTHLVVKDMSANTPKIECARKAGISIVTLEAIDEAWQYALSNECTEMGLRVQDVEVITIVSPKQCFAKKKFCLLYSDDADRIEAEQLIILNGGLIVPFEDTTVDFVLAPLIVSQYDLLQNRFFLKKLRTYYWMHKCVEESVILYGAHELFVPIEFHEANRGIFADCVIALSGMNVLDRSVYEVLLQKHGAKVQNALCKNKTLRGGVSYERNTHFIAGAESSRITAVRAWKIHVLCSAWILQSILKGERLSEPMYDFDNAGKVLTSRDDDLWNAVFGYFPESQHVVVTSPMVVKSNKNHGTRMSSPPVNAPLNTCISLDNSSRAFISENRGINASNLANKNQVPNAMPSLQSLCRVEQEVLVNVGSSNVLPEQQSHFDVNVRKSVEPSSRLSCAESVYLDGERPFNIRFTEEDQERLKSINQEKPSQPGISDGHSKVGLFPSYTVVQDEDGWLDKRVAQASSMMSTMNDENRIQKQRISKKKVGEESNSTRKRLTVSYDRTGSQRCSFTPSDVVIKSPSKKQKK